MQKLGLVFALGSMTSLAVACVPSERDLGGTYADDLEVPIDTAFYGDPLTSVSQARLMGNMGPMRGLDENAQPTGVMEPGWADIQLITANRGGSAMHMVTIAGGVDHPDFQPGLVRTFRNSNYGDGELNVAITACSGTGEVGDWSYDVYADEVTVEVSETETPDVVRVDYEATTNDYAFGADVSSGSFLVQR